MAVLAGLRLFANPAAGRSETWPDLLFLGGVTVFLLGLVRSMVGALDSSSAGIGFDTGLPGVRWESGQSGGSVWANRSQADEADAAAE